MVPRASQSVSATLANGHFQRRVQFRNSQLKEQDIRSSKKHREIPAATLTKPYSMKCHEIYGGRLNQYRYRDILENALAHSRDLFEADQDWLFQQDNLPCHTAHSITEYFAESNVQLMLWPARSPDLNLIENLWSWMDYQLSKKLRLSLSYLHMVTCALVRAAELQRELFTPKNRS